MRRAIGRNAHAQSGCLSFGSQRIGQRRSSATCHGPVGCLSVSSQRLNKWRQSATHYRQAVTCPWAGNGAQVLRHLQHANDKLAARPSAVGSPLGSNEAAASGKLSGNQKGASMQTLSEPAMGTTFVFSSPSPSLPSLTWRSRSTQNQWRICEGQADAPYLCS